MSPFLVCVIIALGVTAGLFLNVVTNFIDTPTWAKPVWVWLILLLLGGADFAVTYLQQSSPVASASVAGDDAAPPSGLQQVSAFDPSQASKAILAITGYNSGKAKLAETRLDGAATRVAGPGPVGGSFALANRLDQIVVSGGPNDTPGAGGLSVEQLDGVPVRTLTTPPAGTWDYSPTVTSGGQVYFVRFQDAVNLPQIAVVMRVPLSGGPATRVALPFPITPSVNVSVNSAGTSLAFTCNAEGPTGPEDVCTANPMNGHLRSVVRIPPEEPVSDVALSPDGRYVAFTRGAETPYGIDQVYVADLGDGATVLASELPGANEQSSWVIGAGKPCLLFSNSQTGGDYVYLSCLELGGGVTTARVGPGDYPIWLGSALPAPGRAGFHVDWNAIWERDRPAALLMVSIVLSVLIGMFANWLPNPAWIDGKSTAIAFAALTIILVADALVVPSLSSHSQGGLTTVSALDPAQANGVLLAQSTTSGDDQEIAGRLDGTDIQPLAFYPATNFIPANATASEFIDSTETRYDPGAYIQLVDATGTKIRQLSRPTAEVSDHDPTLAVKTQEVYFQRSNAVVRNGEIAYDTVIMQVPLAGGQERRVRLLREVTQDGISVNPAGTELAWFCSGICVTNLRTGSVRFIASRPCASDGIAISSDGRYVAYACESYVYAVDLATGTTTEIAQLAGYNDHPSWVTGSDDPCVLFGNAQTISVTVYLACLTPQPAWAPVTLGDAPAWIGP